MKRFSYLLILFFATITLDANAQWEVLSSGSANAFTLNNYPANFTAYTPGITITFKANHTITGAATLNVNSLGAIPILKHGNLSLVPGDIEAGQFVTVIYDAGNSSFQMTSGLGNDPTSSGWSLSGNAGTTLSNFIGTTDIQPLFFKTNSNERMRIAANGEVSIGSLIPDALLHVRGNSGNQLKLGHGNQPGLEWSFSVDATSHFSLINEGAGAPVTRLFIDNNSGHFGFGNTLPSERLDVTGNIKYSGAIMPGGNVGTSGYLLSSTGGGVNSWIDPATLGLSGSGVATQVAFWNGSTSLISDANFFWDNTNKHMGIGISSPIRKLHIHESAASTVSYGVFTNAATGTTISDGFAVGVSVGGDGVLRNFENTNILFYTNNIERMRIDGAGKFGIGTTIPTEKLHVYGNLRLDSAFMPNNIPGNAGEVLTSQGAGAPPVWQPQPAGLSGSGVATQVAFWNGSTSLSSNADLYWDNINFRLGLGTSAPSGKLHVVTDGSLLGGLRVAAPITTTAGATIYMQGASKSWSLIATNSSFGTGPDKFVIRDYSSAANRFVIDPNGKTGIGTDNPTEKLHVYGNLRLDSAFMPNNIPGNSGEILTSQGAGNPPLWQNGTTALGSYFVQNQNTSDQSASFRVSGSGALLGNMGIGTSSPATKLHVVTGSIEAARLESTSNPMLTFYDSTAYRSYIQSYNTHLAMGTQSAGAHILLYPSGNVGIGTSAPANKLTVNAGVSIGSSYTASTAPTDGLIVQGNVSIGTTSGGYPLYINSNSEDTYGQYIYHRRTTGQGMGLYVYSLGENTSTYNQFGINNNTYNNNGSGATYGIRGTANGTSTGTKYGIFGYASGSGTLYAGYFSGNVHVTGNLSASGTKPFKIDHPLDPENKYLYHFALESPDVLNVYTGNITTDVNGEAIVELPSYFNAINVNFRYQLTCIGVFSQAIILEEIGSTNKFKIKTDKPNVKVSWQVTADRNDKSLKEYFPGVEVEKPANERGKYIDPKAYGLPDSRGANYMEDNDNSNFGKP